MGPYGYNRTANFNQTVYPGWYGATFASNPTLQMVLDNLQTYSGPALPETSGYELNAFNATGAFLTNNIPGYDFDWSLMQAGGSDACPNDYFGNLKN